MHLIVAGNHWMPQRLATTTTTLWWWCRCRRWWLWHRMSHDQYAGQYEANRFERFSCLFFCSFIRLYLHVAFTALSHTHTQHTIALRIWKEQHDNLPCTLRSAHGMCRRVHDTVSYGLDISTAIESIDGANSRSHYAHNTQSYSGFWLSDESLHMAYACGTEHAHTWVVYLLSRNRYGKTNRFLWSLKIN